jgi:hypothetical protein
VHEAVRHNFRRLDDIDPQAALLQFTNQRRQLQFGHPRTDAAMDAVTE